MTLSTVQKNARHHLLLKHPGIVTETKQGLRVAHCLPGHITFAKSMPDTCKANQARRKNFNLSALLARFKAHLGL